MRLHDEPFLEVELPCLAEDVIGQRRLADVVQRAQHSSMSMKLASICPANAGKPAASSARQREYFCSRVR